MEHRMQDLKTDGMSRMERVILFVVLVTLIFLLEMVKQDPAKQEQTADFKRAAQTKGGK
jgi:hypothetical protein